MFGTFDSAWRALAASLRQGCWRLWPATGSDGRTCRPLSRRVETVSRGAARLRAWDGAEVGHICHCSRFLSRHRVERFCSPCHSCRVSRCCRPEHVHTTHKFCRFCRFSRVADLGGPSSLCRFCRFCRFSRFRSPQRTRGCCRSCHSCRISRFGHLGASTISAISAVFAVAAIVRHSRRSCRFCRCSRYCRLCAMSVVGAISADSAERRNLLVVRAAVLMSVGRWAPRAAPPTLPTNGLAGECTRKSGARVAGKGETPRKPSGRTARRCVWGSPAR